MRHSNSAISLFLRDPHQVQVHRRLCPNLLWRIMFNEVKGRVSLKFFIFPFLSPSSPILGHNWKHDLARSCFILEIHNITHWAIPAQKISFTERCMEYVLQSNSSPQSKVSNGNGANGALLALASCVIPVLVVTTMPLLADAHSTGTDPEVARWS